MSETSLARNGVTSPLGKLDDRFEAFRVESTLKADFARLAAEHQKPPAELLRDVMRVVTYGAEAVKRMHCDDVDAVVKMLARKHGE